MPPDFGSPVADQITPPNPNQGLQTLSGILGIARQQQAMQIGQQQLQVGAGEAQSAQQQMRERQLLQQTMLSGKDPDGNAIKGSDGEVDPVAIAGFANKYMPLLGQGVMQSIIKTQNDRIQLSNSVRGLGQNFRNDISGIVRSAIGTQQTPQDLSTALDVYAKQNPDAAPAIARARSLISLAPPNMPQAQRDKALQHLAMEFQPADTTVKEQAPDMRTTTGPGGGVQAYNANPYSAVPMGPNGPETPQGLSPSEAATRVQVMQNNQPGTVSLGSITPGAPGFGGNMPFGSGRYGGQPGANPSFAPSGASMGTPEMFGQMSDHWTRLGNDSNNASRNIGIANNIKSYANGALTGAASDLDRLNGILAAFGKPAAADIKTATDLLNKNSAMLVNSSGGGTDAQRALISAATPNGHMSRDAINEAADQIIANQKMTLAAQKYLQPYRQANDAQGYQTALSSLNNVSDPRIWQFADMSPAQRSAFKASMTPAQQKEFGAKIRAAEHLGVVQ